MKVKHLKGFTRRQIDVLHLLAEQHTYDQMARILGISKNTLHTHVVNIMRKTDIWKQVQLIKYAQEQGYGRRAAS